VGKWPRESLGQREGGSDKDWTYLPLTFARAGSGFRPEDPPAPGTVPSAEDRKGGEECARVVNTYIEGASTHLALNSAPHSIDQTRQAVGASERESHL